MKILLTRPIKESLLFAQELSAKNYQVTISPLIKIENMLNITKEIAKDFDGIVITSANAVRALESVSKETKIFCSGKKSFNNLKENNFSQVEFLGNNIVELQNNLDQNLKLLYLSGEYVTDNLSNFPNVERIIVYTSKQVENPSKEFFEFFNFPNKKIITLFSLRTAENLVYLINKHNLNSNCSNIILACFSQKIADLFAENNFNEILFCAKPTNENMHNLIDSIINENKKR